MKRIASLEANVLAVLQRHLSVLNARLILDRSRHALPIGQELRAGHLPQLATAIRGAAQVFVPEPGLSEMMRELLRLGETPPNDEGRVLSASTFPPE